LILVKKKNLIIFFKKLIGIHIYERRF